MTVGKESITLSSLTAWVGEAAMFGKFDLKECNIVVSESRRGQQKSGCQMFPGSETGAKGPKSKTKISFKFSRLCRHSL